MANRSSSTRRSAGSTDSSSQSHSSQGRGASRSGSQAAHSTNNRENPPASSASLRTDQQGEAESSSAAAQPRAASRPRVAGKGPSSEARKPKRAAEDEAEEDKPKKKKARRGQEPLSPRKGDAKSFIQECLIRYNIKFEDTDSKDDLIRKFYEQVRKDKDKRTPPPSGVEERVRVFREQHSLQNPSRPTRPQNSAGFLDMNHHASRTRLLHHLLTLPTDQRLRLWRGDELPPSEPWELMGDIIQEAADDQPALQLEVGKAAPRRKTEHKEGDRHNEILAVGREKVTPSKVRKSRLELVMFHCLAALTLSQLIQKCGELGISTRGKDKWQLICLIIGESDDRNKNVAVDLASACQDANYSKEPDSEQEEAEEDEYGEEGADEEGAEEEGAEEVEEVESSGDEPSDPSSSGSNSNSEQTRARSAKRVPQSSKTTATRPIREQRPDNTGGSQRARGEGAHDGTSSESEEE